MTTIDETEIPEPVNVTKKTTEQLQKLALTSENNSAVTRELLKRDGRVQLKISSTERDKHAVTVTINGYLYNIPRDKWVVVPTAVIEVLDHASITEYTVKMDSKGASHAEIEQSEVNRFSMSTKPVEPVAPAPAPGK